MRLRRACSIVFFAIALGGCAPIAVVPREQSAVTTWQHLEDGRRFLRAQRYGEAVDAYRAVLSAEPRLADAREGLAESLIGAGRRIDGEKECEKILAAAPDRERARRMLADSLFARRAYPRAVDEYLRLAETRPERSDCFRRAAAAYDAQEAYDQEAAVLARMVAANPDDLTGYLVAAQLERKRLRLDEAETWYREALARDEKYAPAWKLLAELYAHMDADALAAECCERIVSLEPADGASARKLAAMYVRLARSKDARRVLEALVRRAPADFEASKQLGLLHLNEGRPLDAQPLLSRAVGLRPKDARSWYYRGDAYRRAGDNAKAENCLRRAVACDAKWEDPYFALADLWNGVGRTDDMASLLAAGARAMPDNADISLAWALARARGGDLAGANRVLEQAAVRHPESAAFAYHLGANCHELGLFDEAAVQLRRSLVLDPENADALNTLACTYLRKQVRGGGSWEALRTARKAVHLWNANAEFHDTLAQAYLRTGGTRDAVDEMRRAIDLGGTANPVMWEHLGDAYAARKAPSSACAAWRKALALAPEKDDVRRKIAAAEAVPAKARRAAAKPGIKHLKDAKKNGHA